MGQDALMELARIRKRGGSTHEGRRLVGAERDSIFSKYIVNPINPLFIQQWTRWVNFAGFLVHTTIAIFILIWYVSDLENLDETFNRTYTLPGSVFVFNGLANATETTSGGCSLEILTDKQTADVFETVFSSLPFPVLPLLLVFPAVTAIFHLLKVFITICNIEIYMEFYFLGYNWIRWLEYSITASWMIMMLYVISFIGDVYQIVMAMALVFGAQWLGYAIEQTYPSVAGRVSIGHKRPYYKMFNLQRGGENPRFYQDVTRATDSSAIIDGYGDANAEAYYEDMDVSDDAVQEDMKKYERGTYKPSSVWSLLIYYFTAWILIAAAYAPIFSGLGAVASLPDFEVPWYLTTSVIGTCLFFISFGFPHLIYYLGGNSCGYTYPMLDITFEFLSLTSKVFLTLIVFIGYVTFERNN